MTTSCSRKKNKFLNRQWHSVGTTYNVLYNGVVSLEAGKAAVLSTFKDNYWELLPVEQMQIVGSTEAFVKAPNPDFERAEEKAIKAVQKHSMVFKGKEKNKKIDEAYLLLGQSRYFDQRFIPALDAFNQILLKYPSSDQINTAKVWKAKTNLRLENNSLVITSLLDLMNTEDLNDSDLSLATATLAQAYINVNALDSAVHTIKKAASVAPTHEQQGRYHFIEAQLYNKLSKLDSANLALDKVIALNRKIPRAYLINAQLEKIKNYEIDTINRAEILGYLTDLQNDRENRSFLDKIFYRIGLFHIEDSKDSLAVDNFNKSLRNMKDDDRLAALNYENIANIYFQSSKYAQAEAYFDSTMQNLKPRTKIFRSIKRKRDNLKELVQYENVVNVNDSILQIAQLSDKEQIDFFENYIAQLKLEEEKKLAVSARDKRMQTTAITVDLKENSKFYFYNPTSLAYGKNNFRTIWGNRPLEDDWRLSDKTTQNNLSEDEQIKLAVKQTKNPQSEKEKVAYYISKIPSTTQEIDSLRQERNHALFQLGHLYKDKFSDYELAVQNFSRLLQNQPEDRYILPSKYNLYKLYGLMGNVEFSRRLKREIIDNYPKSRYADILLEPGTQITTSANSAEDVYKQLYEMFSAQSYVALIKACDREILRFEGDLITPKIAFLKTAAIGRLNGFKQYKKELDQLVLNYPNSPEGVAAQELLNTLIPNLENSASFVEDSSHFKFKIVFPFNAINQEEIETFFEAMQREIKTVKYFDLTASIDVYSPEKTFVVVHGLKSKSGALGFAELLENKDIILSKEYFGISSINYKTLQIHKNLETYHKH